MHLRSRPILFARCFVEAVTTRPFLRTLLEQRRARDAGDEPSVAEALVVPPAERPIPRAA